MRSRGCWAGCALAAWFMCDVRATDYYVHAKMGADSNSGSASAPFRSLGKLETVMQSGDRAFLSGTFHEPLVLENLSDIVVAQWEGQGQAVLRGDHLITGAWEVQSGVWSTAIPAGTIPSAVVVDWDTSVDEYGRHFGFLYPAPSLEILQETPNSFWFDDAADALRVNLAGDAPAMHQIAYCRKDFDGLTIMGAPTGVSNVVVDGIHSYLWMDSDPGSGYGFKMVDCRDSVLRNHVAIDNGYHGTGWVNYWVANTNNHESNGVVWGCNNDSCYVFYTNVGEVSGARWSDCVAHKYTILGRDGQPLTDLGCVGFACHTSNTGPLVKDLLIERCTVVEYADGNLAAAYSSKETSYPSDPLDWRTYPVRVVESSVVGGKASYIFPSGIAFVRCRLDYSNSGAFSGTGEAVFSDNAMPGAGAVLLDACEVTADLDGPGPRAFFGIRGSVLWTFLNTSFLDTGENTWPHRLFMWYAPQAGVMARGSIFAFRNRAGTRWFGYNDNNAAWLPLHDFADCVYVNVSDTAYSSVSNGSFNHQSEWQALVDPDGLYLSELPFEDESGSTGLGLDAGDPLRTTRKHLPQATRRGINGAAYAGSYGAYQYLCAADITRDGFVNGDDFDEFGVAFEEGLMQADFNGDGFVNGDDYDAFAEAFEEGC